MAIYLGNLSVTEMQARTGVTFPAELLTYLNENRWEKASNVPKGKWHCFDIPFMLIAGDMDTAQMIYDHLKPLTKSFKQPMQIGISDLA